MLSQSSLSVALCLSVSRLEKKLLRKSLRPLTDHRSVQLQQSLKSKTASAASHWPTAAAKHDQNRVWGGGGFLSFLKSAFFNRKDKFQVLENLYLGNIPTDIQMHNSEKLKHIWKLCSHLRPTAVSCSYRRLSTNSLERLQMQPSDPNSCPLLPVVTQSTHSMGCWAKCPVHCMAPLR